MSKYAAVNKFRAIFNVILLTACAVSTYLLCAVLDTVEFPRLRAPQPISGGTWLYPTQFQLLDLPSFKYRINNDACQQQQLQAVVLITSHAGNIDVRNSRRSAFTFSQLRALKLRRVFLLAEVGKNQTGYKYIKQETVANENAKYHDIVQGNFHEAYRNLSYKHAMGLHWAVHYCNSVKYIIKLDDDIVVNYYQLINVLNEYDLENSVAGYVLKNLKPDRGNSKWSVSLNEWPSDYYPTFVSGWLYATSPQGARRLISALNKRFFWIDDVFITGIAREKADVNIVDISQHFALNAESVYCCLHGFACDFVVAPSSGAHSLLHSYMQRVARMKGVLKTSKFNHGHTCVVTGRPQVLVRGVGKLEYVPLK